MEDEWTIATMKVTNALSAMHTGIHIARCYPVKKLHHNQWKCTACLSGTFSFDEIGHAHQLMHDNKHPYGNMACLVNATEKGQGAS